MVRKWRRISPEKRRMILKLAAAGVTQQQIAKQLDLWPNSVAYILRPLGGVIRREIWDQGLRRLSLQERIDIRVGLEQRLSMRCIAAKLNRSPSTVSREINANGGRTSYKPLAAHRRAELNARRPKATKLASNPQLLERVIDDLKELWSPQQIAERLDAEFGDDDSMRISTRRSTSRSTFKAAVSYGGSLHAACARDVPNGCHGAGSRGAVATRTW